MMLSKQTTCFVLSALLAWPVAVRSETPASADEIIAKYLKAIGGREKLDSVKTMKVTGKTVFGGSMESPTTKETKRPNKVRIDFTFQGMTGTQAYDGKTGWSIMPFAGKTEPEKMSEDDVKNIEDQADVDGPLVDYKQKGHQVELAGQEDVEGAPAHKLKVTRKNGDVDYYFLDAETFLPIKITSKRKVQGTEAEVERVLSDYKSVDGLMLAHSMLNRATGAAAMHGGMNFIFEKIELNPAIPDDRFTMPEVKKAEPPLAEKKEEVPPKP